MDVYDNEYGMGERKLYDIVADLKKSGELPNQAQIHEGGHGRVARVDTADRAAIHREHEVHEDDGPVAHAHAATCMQHYRLNVAWHAASTSTPMLTLGGDLGDNFKRGDLD